MAHLRDPFRREDRMPTLRDLLGPEELGNRFELMGPGGQVDRAATEELLNRIDRGPSFQAGGATVFSPGSRLNAGSLRNLMELVRRSPEVALPQEELKRREAESRTIRERELITQAMAGNPNAIAELQRRKGAIAERESSELGREVAPGLSLGTLLKVGTGLKGLDEEAQKALFEKLIPGLSRGKSKLEKQKELEDYKSKLRLAETSARPQRFDLGKFRARLVLRARNKKTGDPQVDQLTPTEAQTSLKELGKSESFLEQLFNPQSTQPGKSGQAPTKTDVEQALQEAGNDPAKAAEILQNRGFDLNAEVGE